MKMKLTVVAFALSAALVSGCSSPRPAGMPPEAEALRERFEQAHAQQQYAPSQGEAAQGISDQYSNGRPAGMRGRIK